MRGRDATTGGQLPTRWHVRLYRMILWLILNSFDPPNSAETNGLSLQVPPRSVPPTLPCFSGSLSTLSHTAGRAHLNQTLSRRDRNRAE